MTDPKAPTKKIAIVTDDPSRDKEKHLAQILIGIAALLLAGSVVWVMFIINNSAVASRAQVQELSEVNQELRDQNALRQRELDDVRATLELEQQVEDCFNSLTSNVNFAAYLYQSASGRVDNLLVAYVLSTPAPGTERTAGPSRDDLQAAVVEATSANVDWGDALEARERWREGGNPLPCPID